MAIDESTYHLLEIYFADVNKDIEKKINHFQKITNALFILTQSLYDNKQEIKYHQRELEGKLYRFGLANQSLVNLIKGNEFLLIDRKVKTVDIFSINSIARMQIESFLMMFYLFFDDVVDSEKEVRYDVYKVHGLQKQLGFKSNSNYPEKEENLKKIRLELAEAVNNIKKSEFYINANEKMKSTYLNPKYAKLIKSETLFDKSGIDRIRVSQMWSIYSNYAHSEHISDRQYNTLYHGEKSLVDNCSLIISMTSVMTSKLILNFKNTFESVSEKYQMLEDEVKHHIEFWEKLKF